MSIDELCPYVRKVGLQSKIAQKFERRRIYDHQIMYCVNGGAKIVIEDNKYKLDPGSLVLIKPNKLHSFYLDKGKDTDIIWVHFDFIYREDVLGLQELLRSRGNTLFSKQLDEVDLIRPEVILSDGTRFNEYTQVLDKALADDVFYDILDKFSNHNQLWQLYCKTLILKILEIILDSADIDQRYNTKKNSQKIVEEVKRYIDKYYFRKLSMNEIGTYFKYNPDYIAKLFKKHMGTTIVKYTNQIRIEKAKILLIKTNLSIEEISKIVGFSDMFYFSKKLKQIEGVSPLQFRKQNT